MTTNNKNIILEKYKDGMANKDKETMDYWRHSTILYERTEMQLAVSTVGFDAYGLYCFLMGKVNFNINIGLALDEDRITLFTSQVKLSIERFNDILKELLKRNPFNKEHYENTGLLTNDAITIYCHSVDPDFVLKNEHLDKVFVFDSFGGARETRTPTISHQILSLARLPVPP